MGQNIHTMLIYMSDNNIWAAVWDFGDRTCGTDCPYK